MAVEHSSYLYISLVYRISLFSTLQRGIGKVDRAEFYADSKKATPVLISMSS